MAGLRRSGRAVYLCELCAASVLSVFKPTFFFQHGFDAAGAIFQHRAHRDGTEFTEKNLVIAKGYGGYGDSLLFLNGNNSRLQRKRSYAGCPTG